MPSPKTISVDNCIKKYNNENIIIEEDNIIDINRKENNWYKYFLIFLTKKIF